MSTWTDETHVRARRAVEEGDIDGENGWAVAYLADALDKIEQLRAESARRMVWLETEQRAHEQTHAALVDMTEHAAHPEITDNRVERAAIQMCATDRQGSVWATLSTEEKDAFRADARATLEAALNPGEEQ